MTYRPTSSDVRDLTPRESCVMALLMDGYTQREIAAQEGIAVTSVAEYLSRIKARWGARTLEHAVAMAARREMGGQA